MPILPFTVLVRVGVALNALLLDEKLDSLEERSCHARWLLSQENLHGIAADETHQILSTRRVRATLAVRTIEHSVYMEKKNYKFHQAFLDKSKILFRTKIHYFLKRQKIWKKNVNEFI